jgi:hypothetical protein
MTDLRDDPRPRNGTTSSGGGAVASPSAAAAGADPLNKLYRMSLTAGLGSGDYVAINNTAIAALLLGLLSVLSLLFPIMLIASVAAVVCGGLALVQIRSSNGTQSGRLFAGLGILLGLALGGAAVGKMVMAGVEKRRDERAIGEVVQRLNDFIVAKQYDQAYQTLFSERFKGDFSQQDFSRVWDSLTPYAGAVKSIKWGERAEITPVPATNTKRAIANGDITFEKMPARQPMMFAKESEGEWEIDGIPQLFEKKQDQQRPATPMPDPTAPLGPEMLQPKIPSVVPQS